MRRKEMVAEFHWRAMEARNIALKIYDETDRKKLMHLNDDFEKMAEMALVS